MTESGTLHLLAKDVFLAPFFDFALPLFILSLCRIFPFVQLSPFLGSRSLPMVAKVGFSISLSPLAMCYMIGNTADFSSNLMYLCIKEIFFGFLLGVISSVPFYVMMMAGSLIDHQKGTSSLMLTDPLLSIQDSPIGIIFVYLLAALYWSSGAAFKALDLLLGSFSLFPADKGIPIQMLESVQQPVLSEFIPVIGTCFRMAIELVAPILGSLLMVDVLLGITNRLTPQVQISFMGQSLKAFIGLLSLALCIQSLFNDIKKKGNKWVGKINTYTTLLSLPSKTTDPKWKEDKP
ncbi:EscT/YscT/HrcT family type III secretion system export apparatus protein [Candidatus Similichlamydia laticola]|uniref:Type III secretion inner membrane protein SctT n=1 Tax=Candidatus Similichlamydia laticola TaxID=2170265 RepID=A0A369KD68_9BACT|nr:flagellar biosynthetic protein FliR [Candidatus Similichlamydia laticola]RDB31848.1 Type III secretion inner membrane protein SctT [Candidatus Similichlamydia laticola]